MDHNTALVLYHKDLLTYVFESKIISYHFPGGLTRTRGGKKRYVLPYNEYSRLCTTRSQFRTLCLVCKRWRQVMYSYQLIKRLMKKYSYRLWHGVFNNRLCVYWLKRGHACPNYYNMCGPALYYTADGMIVGVEIIKRKKVGCRCYSSLACEIRLNAPWDYADCHYKGYVCLTAARTKYKELRLARFNFSQPLLANLMLECIAKIKKKKNKK